MATLILLRGAMGAGKTTVARRLKEWLPEVAVVEADEIKERRYGSAAVCHDPKSVFEEAGRQARAALSRGHLAVVVEPFCERAHVDFVLSGVGLSIDSPDIVFVWLQCPPEKSIERKNDAGTVLGQHGRYARRYRHPDELVIDSANQSADAVAAEVLKFAWPHLADRIPSA